MVTASISIVPRADGFGAEVRGLDCGALDADVAAALRAAWREHRLLIFRETVRSDDDLVALGACFGELRPSRIPSPLTKRPELMVVTNILVDGKLAGGFPDGEIEWHYDGMHQEEPYSGAILYAQEVPSSGGETRFADMCRAYDGLPEATKARVRGLKALSTFDYTTRDGEGKQLSDDTPRAVHPIARELPDGRTSIFVAKLMTDHILDIPAAESKAILNELYEQMSRPEFAYEHPWRPGEAVLWDNRSVVHARNDFSDQERRLLKRVTLR
jgi:taurine dioxygenase